MDFFGIKLVGFSQENGQKLLLTLFMITAIFLIKKLLVKLFFSRLDNLKARFWSRQGLNLFVAFITFLTVISIWFDDPQRLTTGLGLVTAGLAFALQKVVTSFAGYMIIMRGNTFSVGERISMGGIRGDVISLGFLQTTILEMGQPPSVQAATPEIWVTGRQFTGRIVTVTNDKIFQNPVYNYTRDFPFLWEEMAFPIKYSAPDELVEKILLECVSEETRDAREMSRSEREKLENHYGIKTDDILPRVFYRHTDNWLELSVRFIVPEHGIRVIKDRIIRNILKEFKMHNIEIASATFEVVGAPPLKIENYYHSSKSDNGEKQLDRH